MWMIKNLTFGDEYVCKFDERAVWSWDYGPSTLRYATHKEALNALAQLPEAVVADIRYTLAWRGVSGV